VRSYIDSESRRSDNAAMDTLGNPMLTANYNDFKAEYHVGFLCVTPL
jgi:hypothetical protein